MTGGELISWLVATAVFMFELLTALLITLFGIGLLL